jgi:hypothetical protein
MMIGQCDGSIPGIWQSLTQAPLNSRRPPERRKEGRKGRGDRSNGRKGGSERRKGRKWKKRRKEVKEGSERRK